MKTILLIAFFFVLSASAFSQNSNSYPQFVINDTFSHAQPKDSKIIPKNYQLTSSNGFKIDCSSYDFTQVRALNNGKDPDVIFVVCKSGNFAIELNIHGITVVDKSTMQSLDNPSKSFTGFIKGDTPILGIGTLGLRDGKIQMLTYWVSMLDVK